MNGPLLLAMLWVLVTWLLWAAVLTGWGLLALRLLRLTEEKADLPWWSFWFGFGSLLAFFQIWHCFLPIDGWAACAAYAVGLAGLAREGSSLLTAWRHWHVRRPRAWLWILLAGAWLANQACGPNAWPDSFSYHLTAVQWTEAYPIVPGLVNLHMRLGFNSASYLFLALVDQGPWAGRYTHFAHGVFAWVIVIYMLEAGYRFLETEGAPRWRAFFTLGWLMPLLVLVRAHLLSTTATDYLAILLVLVAAGGLLELAELDLAPERQRFLLFNVALALVTATTLKASNLFFMAGAGCLALWWGALSGRIDRRAVLIAAALGALAIIPWMVRNAILTGYPLYPGTLAGLPVDWREPPERTASLVRLFRDFARGTMNHPDAEHWVGSWWALRVMNHETRWWMLGPLSATAAGLLAALPRLRRWPELPAGLRRGTWLVLPVAISLAAWFIASPDPRYAAQFFWVLASLVWALAAALWVGRAPRWGLRLVLVLWLVYLSAPLTWQFRLNKVWEQPGPDLGFQPETASGQTTEFETRSGLRLCIPLDGGKSCAHTPLLYTPVPDADVCLRRPGDLSAGFRLQSQPKPTTP